MSRELLFDLRRHGLGGGYVGAAAGGVARFQLGKSADVERRRLLGIQAQNRIVINDRPIEPPEPEIDETAGAEGAHLMRPQAQRLVQSASAGSSRPAAKFARQRRSSASANCGSAGDRLREIGDGTIEVAFGLVHEPAAELRDRELGSSWTALS